MQEATEKERRDAALKALSASLPALSSAQLEALGRIALALETPVERATNDRSDFASEEFSRLLGDVLVIHHVLSSDSFTKDKFEHAMVDVLNKTGSWRANIAPRGNPGHDLTVDEERWSLKTQADRSIKPDRIHISKFMELGRGAWATESDLENLRAAMFRHMDGYDRIFTLRCLSAARSTRMRAGREYELVEIPKSLLEAAAGFPCVMNHDSGQNPKPGYCRVPDEEGGILLELYFDGGTERKLQIRNLSKEACVVHASWRFSA